MAISILLWTSSLAMLLHNAQSSNITAYLSQKVARVGDNVTLTCTLTGVDSNTVTVNKGVSPTNGTYTIEQIAINDVISVLYKKFQRFSIVKSTEGNSVTFTLRITGVQLEDSGGYGCYITQVAEYAWEVLSVYRKPTSMSFYLDNQPVTNNSEINVQEAKNPINITCRAAEVMPEPSLEICVEREAMAPRNITDDFAVVSQKNVHCTGSSSDKSCPVYPSYTTEAKNRAFNVSFVHDSKKLSCVAKMNAFEMETIVAEVTLRVHYLPKILCAGLWNTTLNATDLEIRCRVNAFPVSNSSNKHVSVDHKGAIVMVNPGEDGPLYSLQDKVEMNTDDKISTMIFTIKTVTEENFDYTYTFYAKNSLGATEKRIRIQKSVDAIYVDGAEGTMKRMAMLPTVLMAFALSRVFLF